MNADEKLIHNERTKLTGNWFNAIGAAAVVLGAVTPLTLVIIGLEKGEAPPWRILWGAFIWIPVGGSKHWSGRRILRRLVS